MPDPVDSLDSGQRDLLSRYELMRRSLVGLGALVAAPALLSPSASAAATGSSDASTFTIFGPDYATLDNWSGFEKATGMKMKWSIIADVTGVFVNKVVAGKAGETNDLLFFDGGVQNILAPKGYFIKPDFTKLVGWDKVPPGVKNDKQMTYQGKPFGIPGVYNADSFGYYPRDLGRPTSFSVIFEDNHTLDKVAVEDNWLTTLPMAATYMISKGYAKIQDPSDMNPDELKQVIDFLIKRKKEKQFRTFWSSWEQAVNLLGTREVIVANVWEPVIRALLAQGKKVAYAYTKEGYNKWMGAFWIPPDSKDNPDVYKALNYFLGGDYAAHVAALRGYATGRPDLAVAYVHAHPSEFKKADRDYILQKNHEIQVKYRARYFSQNAAPRYRAEIEGEWERFKQA
jgi:putative spermidine/putrescine transport system substrate-binding protein